MLVFTSMPSVTFHLSIYFDSPLTFLTMWGMDIPCEAQSPFLLENEASDIIVKPS